MSRTKKLSLHSNLKLPIDAACETFAILGKRGSGKSNTAVVMFEQMVRVGAPAVVLDPMDNWYGVKSSFDGKGPGLEVPIFGGSHGDLPLEPTGGKLVADILMSEGISAILAVKDFSKGQRKRFASDLLARLYQKNHDPLHIFLEEAEIFAPQTVRANDAELAGDVRDVVLRGRASGLGLTAIVQRTSLVNKDVLTQMETLVCHRLTGKTDIDAAKAWTQHHCDDEQSKELLASLAKLEDGEAWVSSPHWLNIFGRFQIDRRSTFDSAATPKPGERRRKPKSFAELDLGSIKVAMADTIEREKAEDPKELKKTIREQGKLIKQLESKKAVPDQSAIERAVDKAVAENTKHWKSEIAKLERSVQQSNKKLMQIHGLSDLNGDASVRVAEPPPAPKRFPDRKPTTPGRRETVDTGDVPFGKAEQSVLQALYWMQDDEEIDKGKISFYTGYKPTASTINVALSRLRKAGFIEGVSITDEGLSAVPNPEDEKPTGDRLHEWASKKVGKAENAILNLLLGEPGDSFTLQEIASLTDYSPDASTIPVAISRLKKLGAVEGVLSTGVKAADIFFD